MSSLTSNKVRKDVAMTGEITLRGRVLPIGGLKEKIYAAIRAGIKTVLIPHENKNEIVEFDKDILRDIKIIPLVEAKSVLKYALSKPVIPLNLNESEILKSQKSSFQSENIKENITH